VARVVRVRCARERSRRGASLDLLRQSAAWTDTEEDITRKCAAPGPRGNR